MVLKIGFSSLCEGIREMSKMPVLFIGHGSPMNTLEANGYTVAWRAFGKMIPTPKAILSISAHWFMGNSSRSEEHTSELQSLMRISYAVFCLKKKQTKHT